MSLKTELVIFDWDGTLYNSVGQIVAVYSMRQSSMS